MEEQGERGRLFVIVFAGGAGWRVYKERGCRGRNGIVVLEIDGMSTVWVEAELGRRRVGEEYSEVDWRIGGLIREE